MKRYSQLNSNINEACATSDVNPGNLLSNTGVANHYTPVQNILTNIKNLYCVRLGVVAAIAEDGLSIKLNSTKFIDTKSINQVLGETLYNDGSCLKKYIIEQGLDKMSVVDLGMYKVVYFSPSDIKGAGKNLESNSCQEGFAPNVFEAELLNINEASNDDDIELEDETHKSLMELVKSKDKVKAAKQFSAIVSKEVALPDEFYFCGVKDSDGEESIALRWRYVKKRPHGKSIENTRSLMNIYGEGKDAIWVQDFDEEAYFKLPDEVRKLIESVLELLGAGKTKNPCVWTIGEDEESNKDDKENKDENDEDSSSAMNEEPDTSDEDEDDDSDDGSDLLGDTGLLG